MLISQQTLCEGPSENNDLSHKNARLKDRLFHARLPDWTGCFVHLRPVYISKQPPIYTLLHADNRRCTAYCMSWVFLCVQAVRKRCVILAVIKRY